MYSSIPRGEPKSGLLARQVALEIVQVVAMRGAYADVALERALSKKRLKSKDHGLVMELAYGSIRKRYWLDCWIDFLGKLPATKQPPSLRWLLHIGLYQIFCMDKIPASAAVNTSVEIAKSGRISKLAPVVNGLLRSAIRAKEAGESLPIPQDHVERIAQEQSLPHWLVKKLILWRGESGADVVANAFNKSPSLDLRVNRLLTTPEILKKLFENAGLQSDFVDGSPDALQLSTSTGDVRQLPRFKDGEWSVQDRSAQWVAPLLGARSGERILDACAAPGGKTTHLAELIGDIGEIWAVDRSLERLQRLAENVDRLGITSIRTLVADSSNLLNTKPLWEGSFKRILVDAPCSGLGTLARHPDARWRINPHYLKELLNLQRKLLDGLLPLLSPGGRIVYSTCTIFPEENCNQVKRFLSYNPKLKLVFENQIWPGQDNCGDGFYAAVMDLE